MSTEPQSATPSTVPESGWITAEPRCSAAYLTPGVIALAGSVGAGTRVLDIGCGNGAMAGEFLKLGCTVVGIDASEAGIDVARRTYPGATFVRAEIIDDILPILGQPPFDLVISTEVVEHLYNPHAWARCAFNALRPGGRLVCSTPYHGYLKNLAISIFNGWDRHNEPLQTGGHIKFFSRATLSALLEGAGFVDLRFRGAGRTASLWMSMIMSGERGA